VREQLKYPGLHLDTKQGVLLAKTTGATHVAVGELTEKGMTATLTYRLHSLDNKPLGEPIVLTGTRDDLTKQLPGLAALIAFRLGAPLTKPQPLPPSGMEMTQLGSCVRAKPMKPEQEAFLARFATQNIAATVLNLSVGPARRNPVEFNRLVTALLITEPENPLIYGQIGYIGANALVPHKATFAIAAKKYPKNYALAHTSVWLARVENDTVAERQAAQRAVQNAPRNPDAYLTLGWTVAETAHQVRKGKTYGNMTPTEQTFVARVYPEWSKVVRRATELDPLYAKAWLRLAESATFNGNAADAVAAWETAEKTGCNPYDLYDWGLQMFQDKWGGSPARLRKVGEAAVKAQYNTIGEALDILANLQDAGLSDLAAQMGSDLLKQAQDAVQKQPNLAQAHYDLAQVYKATGDSLNAIAAYEKVAALRPNDADAQYDLGFALGEKGMNKQAAMALQEAIRRAPDHHRAYAMLAWTQKHMGDLLQAEAAAKKSVELRSDYAQGWAVLGTIYAYQKKDDACIAAYRKALALWPHFPEAYHNMHVIYARRNDWENDLKVLTQLALYRPENAGVFVNIAHCYQMKKDWKRSAEASREALAREENNPYAYANLGVALLHLGNKSEGKQACEQAIALAPEPQFAREVEAEMTKLLKPKKTTTN
jgi:tetratricopeptide (TPR) repeat protein